MNTSVVTQDTYEGNIFLFASGMIQGKILVNSLEHGLHAGTTVAIRGVDIQGGCLAVRQQHYTARGVVVPKEWVRVERNARRQLVSLTRHVKKVFTSS